MVVLFLATPLALFFTRPAAAIAVIGAAVTLVWPLGIALQESIVSAAPFAILPATALTVGITRLWRTRNVGWFALVPKPAVWLRVALAGLPFVMFVLLFDVRAVLAVLLAGPRG